MYPLRGEVVLLGVYVRAVPHCTSPVTSLSICLCSCPRQDSGQGESDSDKQSYDESDDSTDNQVIDTDVDQILRWKKGKLLGKGAYGRVWEGLTDSTRMIAVKEVELDSDCQEKAESVSFHSNMLCVYPFHCTPLSVCLSVCAAI